MSFQITFEFNLKLWYWKPLYDKSFNSPKIWYRKFNWLGIGIFWLSK